MPPHVSRRAHPLAQVTADYQKPARMRRALVQLLRYGLAAASFLSSRMPCACWRHSLQNCSSAQVKRRPASEKRTQWRFNGLLPTERTFNVFRRGPSSTVRGPNTETPSFESPTHVYAAAA